MGIPVACETDIYGALSEYIATCATKLPATILDINNTVPKELYEKNKNKFKGYKETDLFMGFHCGNTPCCHMKDPKMQYQLIMHRLLEGDKEPDISRGTLEGQIKEAEISMFRLQSIAEGKLKSYIVNGNVIDVDPESFGIIGIFCIKEMARFYRYVLIEKRYPHYTAIAFKRVGKVLFEAMKMFDIVDISYNQPSSILYKGENPF